MSEALTSVLVAVFGHCRGHFYAPAPVFAAVYCEIGGFVIIGLIHLSWSFFTDLYFTKSG